MIRYTLRNKRCRWRWFGHYKKFSRISLRLLCCKFTLHQFLTIVKEEPLLHLQSLLVQKCFVSLISWQLAFLRPIMRLNICSNVSFIRCIEHRMLGEGIEKALIQYVIFILYKWSLTDILFQFPFWRFLSPLKLWLERLRLSWIFQST